MGDPEPTTPAPEDGTWEEERWRGLLTGDVPPFRLRRRIHARIPSGPRCKLCAAPFRGPGGLVMSRMGHERWAKNPKYCAGCFRALRQRHGGAEVECSLLFADVRGSTGLAERMRPREFNRLMGRFYDTAAEVLVRHDAIVDKFVGDEVIGLFVPVFATDDHPRRAVDAALALLGKTGHGRAAGPWVPVGAGVNTGIAYVGAVGEGMDTELTAMGDSVNTTARLASAARTGEVLVTREAARAAGLSGNGVEHRSLSLRGKSEDTDVLVLTAG